jgi:hypothetical protein
MNSFNDYIKGAPEKRYADLITFASKKDPLWGIEIASNIALVSRVINSGNLLVGNSKSLMINNLNLDRLQFEVLDSQ